MVENNNNYTPAGTGKNDLNEVFTIPNIISFIRIIVITPFVVCFLNENYVVASIILAISGLSDCIDGYIARKFNQVTKLGKILDPIADKLTLLAVAVCIAVMTPEVIPVLAVLIIKDLLMLIGGSRIIRAGLVPPPARWYGKLATLLFYISVCTIVFLKAVYRYESIVLNFILLTVTTLAMIFALIKYYLLYRDLMKSADSAEGREEKN